MLFKMALRNISRHTGRTVFGVIAIAFGVMLMILFAGLFEGANISMLESMIRTKYGDLRLYTRDYFAEIDRLPLENLFQNASRLTPELQQIKGVVAVAPRLEFTSFISDGTSEIPLIGVGIDPQLDNEVFPLARYIVAGHYLEPDDAGIMLSASICEDFGVTVGDYITVMARTKFESISADDFPIIGIFNTHNPDVDETSYFVNLKVIQEFLELDDEVSVPVVRVMDRHQVDQVVHSVITGIENGDAVHARTWLDMTREIMAVVETKSSFSKLFLFLLMVMAAFGIMNTMLMSFFERLKEMGTLAALGMKHRQIYWLFLSEGALMGLIGMLIGMLLGGGLNYWISQVGLNYEKMGFQFALEGGRYYTVFNLSKIGIFGLVGFLTALISAWYPARRIRKLEPAEVLRK